MAFATLGLGMFRDHKSNQELARINEQNLSLREWIGPREVNKNALKASVGDLGGFAMEIVQLPNVIDGEPIAKAMFDAALQAFAVDAHSSKEVGRLSVGQLRVLVAQKDR